MPSLFGTQQILIGIAHKAPRFIYNYNNGIEYQTI